jgi:TrmH family RNA methyltransferase
MAVAFASRVVPTGAALQASQAPGAPLPARGPRASQPHFPLHSLYMQIGRHNSRLVQLRKAVRSGTLTSDGLLPIEGPILLEEAYRSGVDVVDVFVRQDDSTVPSTEGTVYDVPPDLFKTIQATEHSQGVVATVRLPRFTLEDVLKASPALVVILARLQDPGNVGTIIRVSESFGATGCIALRDTASLHNGKVIRASTGSIFRLPHVAGVTLPEAVEACRSGSISLVGTSPAAAETIENWDWERPTALLVGNEGGGLNDEELGYCDTVLRIPQKASVESLNSAIATAVLLYEAFKQRR